MRLKPGEMKAPRLPLLSGSVAERSQHLVDQLRAFWKQFSTQEELRTSAQESEQLTLKEPIRPLSLRVL